MRKMRKLLWPNKLSVHKFSTIYQLYVSRNVINHKYPPQAAVFILNKLKASVTPA